MAASNCAMSSVQGPARATVACKHRTAQTIGAIAPRSFVIRFALLMFQRSIVIGQGAIVQLGRRRRLGPAETTREIAAAVSP